MIIDDIITAHRIVEANEMRPHVHLVTARALTDPGVHICLDCGAPVEVSERSDWRVP